MKQAIKLIDDPDAASRERRQCCAGHSQTRERAQTKNQAGIDANGNRVPGEGVIFAILPSWGLSNAAATLVGQNLGAKQPDRAETSVWRTGFYNMLFLGGVGVFFILFAEPIVRLFTHDPAVVPLGTSCLRILSYGTVGYAYGMVMLQAFNGAG